MEIDGRPIGHDHPCYVIAEIGINHNGEVQRAKALIDVAVAAGCDAVKFQARTPELCVPRDQWDRQRELPDGRTVSYIDYKRWLEFGDSQWSEVIDYCAARDMTWFASCWDDQALGRMLELDIPALKVASASLADDTLMRLHAGAGKPILLSTGMSTLEEIDRAVSVLRPANIAAILQSTSAYPVNHEDIHLHVMQALGARYGLPYGYSGHERGLAPTVAAVAMGACVVERHICLDRTDWGTDQAAALEPPGIYRLVRDIRAIEAAKGSAEKRVLACELAARAKLRGGD